MIDRRRFLSFAAVGSVALVLPSHALTQDDGEEPDFDIAGSIESDPPGYTIAWSSDWETVEREAFTAETIPGVSRIVGLDLVDAPDVYSAQRIIIETRAMDVLVRGEELLNSLPDNYPETDMGYAPGTRIETRQVTDGGCWFSFAGGEDPFATGTIGLSLYYTPGQAEDPLVNVSFNFAKGQNRTPEFLETIDSTISLNDNWLLGMDELDAYWEAFEQSTESTLS